MYRNLTIPYMRKTRLHRAKYFHSTPIPSLRLQDLEIENENLDVNFLQHYFPNNTVPYGRPHSREGLDMPNKL